MSALIRKFASSMMSNILNTGSSNHVVKLGILLNIIRVKETRPRSANRLRLDRNHKLSRVNNIEDTMARVNDRHVADRNDCHAPKLNGSQVYNSDNKLGDRGIVEEGLVD